MGFSQSSVPLNSGRLPRPTVVPGDGHSCLDTDSSKVAEEWLDPVARTTAARPNLATGRRAGPVAKGGAQRSGLSPGLTPPRC